MLLSSIQVNTALDGFPSGLTSLRAAISMANNSTEPTTITFDPTVFDTPQTIALNGNDLSLTGPSTTISGPSAGVTIDALGQSGVFVISAGSSATLSGLTITGGSNSGIRNSGALTLTNATVSGNTVSGLFAEDGGGLYNSGTATVSNVTFFNNTAAASGGGVYNSGFIDLTRVTLSINTASGLGGGGINNEGTAIITDSTIFGNKASNSGGGVLNTGSATISNSTISLNDSNNQAGGIYSAGFATLNLVNVTVAFNATFGPGGGINKDGGGTATLTNVTVYSNSATGTNGGGGIYVGPFGPAVTIRNSIVAGNSASVGPDVRGAFNSPGFNLVGQTDDSTGWNRNGPDLTGTVANPLDPDLLPLDDYGGPTRTMPPDSGSPVINQGSNSLIPSGVTTDQQGAPRTSGGTVDMGAVEFQFPRAATTTAIAAAPTAVEGQGIQVTVTVSGAGGLPTGSVEIYEGATLLSQGTLADGTANFTNVQLPVGDHSISARYIGDGSFAPSESGTIALSVTPAPDPIATTAVLTAAPNPAVAGGTTQLTVTVTAPGGSGVTGGAVTFFLDGTSLGQATVSSGGVAALTTSPLTEGSHSITASYAGDLTFGPSESAPLLLRVAPPPPQNGPDLTGTLSATLPSAVIGGAKAKAKASVLVKNDGTEDMAGPVTVTLFVSSDQTLDAGDAQVTAATKNLKLKRGASKAVALKVANLPAVADGSYFLLAQVDSGNRTTERNEANNVSASGSTVTIARPFIDLTGSFSGSLPGSLAVGKKATASVLVRNSGNSDAAGPMSIALFASADGVLDGADLPLTTLAKGVKLKPGASKAFKIKFTVPAGLTAGTYRLIASVDSLGQIAESDDANNVAVAGGGLVIA